MAKNGILIECKMRIKNPSLKIQIENEKMSLKVGKWDREIGLWKNSWDARNAGAAGQKAQELNPETSVYEWEYIFLNVKSEN